MLQAEACCEEPRGKTAATLTPGHHLRPQGISTGPDNRPERRLRAASVEGAPGRCWGQAGYGTSVGELAIMGAITGLPLGAAQALLLRGRVAYPWVWAAAMPLLWALGWTVTAAAGVGVDRQYAVFGAFGAITFMALSGVLLDRLRAATPATPSPPNGPPTATA